MREQHAAATEALAARDSSIQSRFASEFERIAARRKRDSLDFNARKSKMTSKALGTRRFFTRFRTQLVIEREHRQRLQRRIRSFAKRRSKQQHRHGVAATADKKQQWLLCRNTALTQRVAHACSERMA